MSCLAEPKLLDKLLTRFMSQLDWSAFICKLPEDFSTKPLMDRTKGEYRRNCELISTVLFYELVMNEA